MAGVQAEDYCRKASSNGMYFLWVPVAGGNLKLSMHCKNGATESRPSRLDPKSVTQDSIFAFQPLNYQLPVGSFTLRLYDTRGLTDSSNIDYLNIRNIKSICS